MEHVTVPISRRRSIEVNASLMRQRRILDARLPTSRLSHSEGRGEPSRTVLKRVPHSRHAGEFARPPLGTDSMVNNGMETEPPQRVNTERRSAASSLF